MPTISFTSQFMQDNSVTNSAIGRMMAYAVTYWEPANVAGRAPIFAIGIPGDFSITYTSEIHLMKGTVPTQSDLNGYTTWSARSSDALVSFTLQPNTFTPSSTTYYANPAVISSSYVGAAATGVATWFWWVTRPRQNAAPQQTIYQSLAGTIGAVGSGSDLEIASTTINTGQQIRIQNLRLVLPKTFTY